MSAIDALYSGAMAAEAVADVLRVAGRDEVAAFIVEAHAVSDEEGDAHDQGAVCSCSDPTSAALTGHGHGCEVNS